MIYIQKIKLDATHVHFIGIGGISMSGLAEILKRNGFTVSGSDSNPTEITEHLNRINIPVTIGNTYENIIDGIGLVVYTAAIKTDNPEYRAAAEKGIPLMERAKLLGIIMDSYAYPICVAGTHGKTTTTSMIADTCLAAGLDPTINLGGHMGDGYNFKIGDSPYFVLEACEYARQFLHWKPYIGVILNIDNDHMDCYGNMDNLIASFKQFAGNIKPEGALVIHQDVPGFVQITDGLPCRVVTFGGSNADFSSTVVTYNHNKPLFKIQHRDAVFGTAILGIPGEHNILNALACTAVTFTLGIKPDIILHGLRQVKGAKRRYEHKGIFNGADVVDDYAHHPTEIRTFLSAVRKDRASMGRQGRVICLFQPHTYTRTRNLLMEISQSFDDADTVILLPIFASREKFDPTISSRDVVDLINEKSDKAFYLDGFDQAVDYLKKEVKTGDLFITMGAGDVYLVGERLLHTELSTVCTGE